MTIDLDKIAVEVADQYYVGKTKVSSFMPGVLNDFAHALLARLEADGWQLVPKEPTDVMVEEVAYLGPDVVEIYKAMLSAAPKVGK